ncbi:MAG TPA: hypothetical protein DDW76_23775 [Cyanobacteria bacterium UBA11369]|nr:hypothetical protein [Cyanobacteria bacterium UBA11371]HBE32387.1 hypothetical protein [Cyanobacteria bacterium UBA11368]HBE51709.1 hypothetical protein [Cyanobacteria bacterium UBA11369]
MKIRGRAAIAGTFTRTFLTIWNPRAPNQDIQLDVYYENRTARFSIPITPDRPPPDDDDEEDPPPCDIPITSDFEFGYFCLTRVESDRLIGDLPNRNIEQNLERFR